MSPPSSTSMPQSVRAVRNSSTMVASARWSASDTKSAGPLRLTCNCSTSPKSRLRRGAAFRAARVMTVMRPECETILLGALHIFATVYVDNDPGSGGDMRRDHHANAIVELGRLVARARGLALHHRVSLDDRRFDLIGQLHADRPLVIELHHYVHSVLEEGRGLADQIFGQRHLLVRVLVHEHEHVAVVIQILKILGVEADALDRLGRAEANVVLAAVNEVFQLDLHVGAALARLGVLDFDGAPNAAFIFDDVAGTDVHAADLHGIAYLIESM